MRLPIDIEGIVAIKGPGLAATVRAAGREVVCDLPNLSVGLSMLKLARQARVLRLPVQSMLDSADIRLSVRLRGRVIAEAGPGVVTGRLAALCGLNRIRFRLFRSPGPWPRTTP